MTTGGSGARPRPSRDRCRRSGAWADCTGARRRSIGPRAARDGSPDGVDRAREQVVLVMVGCRPPCVAEPDRSPPPRSEPDVSAGRSPSPGGPPITSRQVGHHQRASSGVPQTSWRAASAGSPWRPPQSASSRMAPASSRPSTVRPYASRTGAVRTGGDDDARPLEPLQPGGQDVRSDAADRVGDLAEAPRPLEQGLHDQQAPASPTRSRRRRAGSRTGFPSPRMVPDRALAHATHL